MLQSPFKTTFLLCSFAPSWHTVYSATVYLASDAVYAFPANDCHTTLGDWLGIFPLNCGGPKFQGAEPIQYCTIWIPKDLT